MKFRILFALFNIVLISAFLSIIFLPFFAVSPSFMTQFWKDHAVVPVFFIACLVALNLLFALNWPVLSLLEREDWPGLANYLEASVLGKNRLHRRSIRLFLESHVLLGDFAPIETLSDRLARAKPALWRHFAPRIAAALILAGSYQKALAIAESALDCRLSRQTREWCVFYAGLARFMQKDYATATASFIPLARSGAEPLVVALSGYLCTVGFGRLEAETGGKNGGKNGGKTGGDQAPTEAARVAPGAAREARERISSRFRKDSWRRYLERERADIRIVILGSLTDQASTWLFSA